MEDNFINTIKEIFSEELKNFNFNIVKSIFNNQKKEFVFKNDENIRFIINLELLTNKNKIKMNIILQGEIKKKFDTIINKNDFDQNIIINTVKEFMKFHSDYISNYNKNRYSSFLIFNPNNNNFSIIQSGVCFDWDYNDNLIYVDDERCSSLVNLEDIKIYNEKDWTKFYQRYIRINENNKKFEKIFLEENNLFEHNLRNDDISENNNFKKIDFMNFIFVKKKENDETNNIIKKKENEKLYKRYDISKMFKEFVQDNIKNINNDNNKEEILNPKYIKVIKFTDLSNKTYNKEINKYINESIKKKLNINDFLEYSWNYNSFFNLSKKLFFSFFHIEILSDIKYLKYLDFLLINKSIKCLNFLEYKDDKINFNISFSLYIYEIFINFLFIREKILKFVDLLQERDNFLNNLKYNSLKFYLLSLKKYFLKNEHYLIEKLINLKSEKKIGFIKIESLINLEYLNYIKIIKFEDKIEVFRLLNNYFDFNAYCNNFKNFHKIKEFMEFENKIKTFIKIYNNIINNFYNQYSSNNNKLFFSQNSNGLKEELIEINKKSIERNISSYRFKISNTSNLNQFELSDMILTNKNYIDISEFEKKKSLEEFNFYINSNENKNNNLKIEDKIFKKFKNLKCSICGVIVKKLGIQCIICGHGGHFNHIKDWIIKNKYCAQCFDCFCFN